MSFVRLANENDIESIMNIVNKVVPLMRESGNFQWDSNYPNPEVFLKDIQNNELWVGIINENIVAGMIAITHDQPLEYSHVGLNINEDCIVPHRMAVDPDCQGKGIAKLLLLQAEVVARQQNINKVRIDTNTENKITTKLFPSLGYQLYGEITLDFRPGLKFLCYEKVINLEI